MSSSTRIAFSKRIVLASMLVAALAPAAAQAPEPPAFETLSRQFEAAEARGDYPAALALARRMEEDAAERHTEVLYDLARMYGLTGDRSKVYEYLYRATDAGFWDAKRMREDPAFASLREEDLFQELCRKAWSGGYLAMLERDEREDFQKKDEILQALRLRAGMFVADVGAGSGYFTIPIARAIGPQGKVLATDIRREMLDSIARRLRIENLENVELLLGRSDDPMLPPGKVDLILMVDVYHYIQERTAFGKKLLAGLAPGGRLVVVDYIPKSWEQRPWGPPPQQHLAEETLSADLAAAGFETLERFDFLPEQFFVVYGRAGEPHSRQD